MKRWIKAICTGATVLAPVAALAGIDGTHHDMSVFKSATTEKCAYCHSIALNKAAAGFGQVGTFCVVVCHDGTGALGTAIPSSPGYIGNTTATRTNWTAGVNSTAVVNFGVSHNATVATLGGLGGIDVAGDVAATNWPHSSQTLMECTTCHAVHDGANPPFLNAPMATGNNTTAFCQQCHTGGAAAAAGVAGRFEAIASMGAHPTEFTMLASSTTGAGPAANGAKFPRAISIKSPGLQVTAGASTTVAQFNAAIGADAWKTGGHFMDAAANMPTATITGSTFGCYSCHSAHQDNAGATSGISSGLLIMGAQKTNLGATAYTSNLCVNCHGAVATLDGINNPGTTAAYHPTNEGTAQTATAGVYEHDHASHAAQAQAGIIPASGTFPILVDVTAIPATYIGNPGSGMGQILCISCHDVHGGVPGQMAIRNIPGQGGTPVGPNQSVCLGCHKDATGTQSAATGWHHPGSTIDLSAQAFPAQASWTTIDGLGKLTDGLSCPDCHVFQGRPSGAGAHRATAHNW